MSREAMKLALEALQYPLQASAEVFDADKAELMSLRAVDVLHAALAEPECMCREPWVLGRVHREKTPCFDYVEREEKNA